MSVFLRCPTHGNKDGELSTISFEKAENEYNKLGQIEAWRCKRCKCWYISTKMIPYGTLPAKVNEGEEIFNIEQFASIPKQLYVYNKSTKKGLCDCNEYKDINSFFGKDSEKCFIPTKYCQKCGKFYITKGTLKHCHQEITDNNIEIINSNCNSSQVNTTVVEQQKNKTTCSFNKQDIDFNDLHNVNKVAKAYMDAKIDYNPYQFLPWTYVYNESVDKLLISDEVGLGKTIEAGILIEEEFSNSPNNNVLVICPAFLRNKWRDELKYKFYQNPVIYGEKKDEVASNLTILPLSRLKRFIEENRINYDLVIVDEVHYFKNSNSARYKYIKTLLDQNRKSKFIFMSATPLNNSDSDYVSISKLFNGPHFTTSTTKKQAYIKLAKRNIKDVYVSLTPSEQELYNTTDILDPFSGTIYRHIGASCLYALTKYAIRDSVQISETKEELRDAITELFEGDEFEEQDLSSFYENINKMDLPKNDSKLGELTNLVDKIEDKKIIIFSHYIETVKYLQSELSSKYNCAYIYGNNISKNISRINKNGFDDAKEWFNGQDINNKTILICSDSCKEGIDLQTASCLINYDLPFNPSILEQRIGRIDRKGQMNEMKIFNFHVDDTYDDRLHCILQTKLMLINYYAEYGVGNPLSISANGETTIDKFIRYFKKDNGVTMSNDDFSVIKKMLRKCNVKYNSEIDQDEILALLDSNKSIIKDIFDENQLDVLTEEQLEIQYKLLDEKLGFPKRRQGIYVLTEKAKESIIELANKDLKSRRKIFPFIIDYENKLRKVEDTGLPMIITEDDIKNELIFSSDTKDKEDFLSSDVTEMLEKDGVKAIWI